MAAHPIAGYVLAGGRSSRMGRDKALIELAGKPLIEHAVIKLRRVCAEVSILSANPALAAYAPLVADIHPGCGPIGGIEAALAHTTYDWNLFLPVDMPLLPTAFIDAWVEAVLGRCGRARVALFGIDRIPQPTLAMLHRDAADVISDEVAQGHYKLAAALEEAARRLAPPSVSASEARPCRPGSGRDLHFDGRPPHPLDPQPWHELSEAQRSSEIDWFTNINTAEILAVAEAHFAALDT